MDNNKIIIVSIIIVIIISIIFIENKHSTKSKEENVNNTISSNINYKFDEENSVYIIYDINTNKVLQTICDESMLQMYLDNPDFDSSFPGIEPNLDFSNDEIIGKNRRRIIFRDTFQKC